VTFEALTAQVRDQRVAHHAPLSIDEDCSLHMIACCNGRTALRGAKPGGECSSAGYTNAVM